MAETIQSTDLRRRVREVLDRVRFKASRLIVQSYDTPQAGPHSLRRLRRLSGSGGPSAHSDRSGWPSCAPLPRRSASAPH